MEVKLQNNCIVDALVIGDDNMSTSLDTGVSATRLDIIKTQKSHKTPTIEKFNEKTLHFAECHHQYQQYTSGSKKL